MVQHNETGLLIDCSDACVSELTEAMRKMILNKDMRMTFSRNAKSVATKNFTWERTGNIISEKLFERFPGWKQ